MAQVNASPAKSKAAQPRGILHGFFVLHAKSGSIIYSQRVASAFGLTSCGDLAKDELRLAAMLFALHLNAAAAANEGESSSAGLTAYNLDGVNVRFCEHTDSQLLLVLFAPASLGAPAAGFLASELLQRFASWAEQLYAGPRDALLRTIQRHGYRVRLDTARRRAHARSVGAALHRGNESVQLFNDMALIDAFRQSARGETVAGAPPAPRGRIAVNTVRPDCVGVINPHTFARSSEYSSLRWVGRTPHVRRPACGAGVDVDWCPLCFIHFQGRAKETLNASEWVRRATARTAGALS